ncbi:MAG: hypothetical protein PVI30_16370 [Myxococcales bacterium]
MSRRIRPLLLTLACWLGLAVAAAAQELPPGLDEPPPPPPGDEDLGAAVRKPAEPESADPEPAPTEEPGPQPAGGAAQSNATQSAVEPKQPPPPPPEQESPPPPPQQRFEGQVSPDASGTYDGYGEPAYEEGYDGPPEGGGEPVTVPGFSIRLDPLNWLFEGRLRLELEVQIWKSLTVELVPVFVANETPPLVGLLDAREDPVSQKSNGIGSMSGASVAASWWLQGAPFRGYVLRAILTNYSYTFEASDSAGVFDRTNVVERRLIGFIGSYSRFGFFTIGGGLGIGYELSQSQRCFANDRAVRSGCPDEDEHLIRASRNSTLVDGQRRVPAYDLHGSLYPAVLEARLSLGVAFD